MIGIKSDALLDKGIFLSSRCYLWKPEFCPRIDGKPIPDVLYSVKFNGKDCATIHWYVPIRCEAIKKWSKFWSNSVKKEILLSTDYTWMFDMWKF